MSFMRQLECCGIAELAQLREDGSPKRSLLEVEPDDQGLVIFSDTDAEDYAAYGKGLKLAALIRKLKIGPIVTIPVSKNPNTGNRVKVWVWRPNRRKFKQWQRSNNSLS